ncbi:hypothetical protein N9112_00355 [bacterium]|nr:hypothetical protein [bacterium]
MKSINAMTDAELIAYEVAGGENDFTTDLETEFGNRLRTSNELSQDLGLKLNLVVEYLLEVSDNEYVSGVAIEDLKALAEEAAGTRMERTLVLNRHLSLMLRHIEDHAPFATWQGSSMENVWKHYKHKVGEKVPVVY